MIPRGQNSQIDIQCGLFSGVFEAHRSMTEDFSAAGLDQMIDLRHPLTVLASRMP